MKKLLLGLSFCLMASTAVAADAIVEEAVDVAPVFTWTGGYIGLQGGYAWGDGRLESLVFDDFSDYEPDGFIGGVYAGYNYQMANNFVIGAEVDAVYADVDDTFEPEELTQELNWSAAARLRLGYAVDRFLPYVAGGVAVGDVELYNIANISIDDTYVGWTIGGGFDYAFTDNLLFRAEYRFTDFGSESFEDEGLELDLQTNEVRFGVAYKF